MAARPELIAVVGPTASGKTGLALDIAEHWDGEIICADSRTIYKGMDVGTAKPTAAEQARVRHWGLDLVEPGQPFSAAEFKTYANKAIADIRSRGKLPLLVGGSGLYVDSVLYDFVFGPATDPIKRQQLEALSNSELIEYCNHHNIELPENISNKRYLVRAIERSATPNSSKSALQPNNYIVGIATDRKDLRTRIVARGEHMFAQNVEQEATLLGKKYGWNSEAMTGNVYPAIKLHLDGQLSRAELIDKIATLDYQLAKRQMTWFRRNPDIMWCDITGAKEYINSLLAAE